MECGSDYYYSFENYEEALEYSRNLEGAKAPLALILKREYLDESSPGEYIHVKAERVTEWPAEFLGRPKRTDDTIPNFLAPDAPEIRLEILRGEEAAGE